MAFSNFFKQAQQKAQTISSDILESHQAKSLQTSMSTALLAARMILDHGKEQIRQTNLNSTLDKIGLSTTQKISLKALLQNTSATLETAEDAAKNLARQLSSAAPDIRENCFNQLLKVTSSFNIYNEDVADIIDELAEATGFPEGDLQRLKQKHGISFAPQEKAETNPYKIIGVPENASWRDVQKKYRTEISKVHPDKISQSNLSEAEKQAAIARASHLNAAKEILKKRLQPKPHSLQP